MKKKDSKMEKDFSCQWYGFSEELKNEAQKSIKKIIIENIEEEKYGEFFETVFFETLKNFELNYSRYDIDEPYILFAHSGTDGYFAKNISKNIVFKHTGLMCKLFQKTFEELRLKILSCSAIEDKPYTFYGKIELVEKSNKIFIQKIQKSITT